MLDEAVECVEGSLKGRMLKEKKGLKGMRGWWHFIRSERCRKLDTRLGCAGLVGFCSCLTENVVVSKGILIDVATGLYRSCDDRMGLVQIQVVA